MNSKKQTPKAIKKETIKTVTETAKELQPVSKSITTINHRSKEAQEERERKFKEIIKEIETKGQSLTKATKK